MQRYRHTQIGYLMIGIFMAVLILFIRIYIAAVNEIPAYDSGPNLLVTTIMVLVLFILASFGSLTVAIDDKYLAIKFGWGIFRKQFTLSEITSINKVKNPWYVGWGIRFWFWPRMVIFNISGFDVVEIQLKNGKRYRIGTDEPNKLETALKQVTGV